MFEWLLCIGQSTFSILPNSWVDFKILIYILPIFQLFILNIILKTIKHVEHNML